MHCSDSRLSPLLLLLLQLIYFSLLLSRASPAGEASLPADALSLLAFKASADLANSLAFHVEGGNRSSNWSHCRWPGVQCSPDGRVVRLVLESAGLNGSFPNATLGRLVQLRLLSLKGNALAGPVPDLSGLANLKALYLDRNSFSGPFPASIVSLHRLRILDLSHNNLSGGIPVGLAGLDHLLALQLEENHFNGPVPPFNQSSLRNFNVSSNDLSGPVPATPVLGAFATSAFAANPGLCGEVVRKDCGSHFDFFRGGVGSGTPVTVPSPSVNVSSPGGKTERTRLTVSGSPSQRRRRSSVVTAGFVAGALVVIGVVGISVAMKRKKNKKTAAEDGETIPLEKSTRSMHAAAHVPDESYVEAVEIANEELATGAAAAATMAASEEKMRRLGNSGCLVFCAGEAQVYTLEQLMRASAELLGKGSAGTTYKAVLDNRLVVTVKRLDAAKLTAAGREVFERHMDAVGKLRHPNLVPLRAYFQAKEERLLVYDYQINGSLYSLIHGSKSTRSRPLHWTSCLKIAEDVAQGLAYIHQAPGLVHSNIKSSNVLLGSDFEACLTDNCLSCFLETSASEADSGYRAPEIQNSNQGLTPRSDIYSFGVLLLELLTGKPPLQHPVLNATDLPVWVRSVREDGADDERLMMIIDIAAACVSSSPESRPTTWQVLKLIQEVKEADMGDDDSDSESIS